MNVDDWANRGSSLGREGKFDEAVACFRRAVALQSGNVDLKLALASTLRAAGQRSEAVDLCEQLLSGADSERLSRVHSLLGNLLQEEDRFDEAVHHLRESIRLSSEASPSQWSCLGIALYRRGDIEEAIGLFERAVAMQPDYSDGHFHLGMALLLQGDYERGRHEYEYRPFGTFGNAKQPSRFWKGESLQPHQTLLLVAEQGFGDSIQFIRFAAEVRERYGCRIILQAPAKLIPLLETAAGIDCCVSRDEATPPYDYYLPLASLLYRLQWCPPVSSVAASVEPLSPIVPNPAVSKPPDGRNNRGPSFYTRPYLFPEMQRVRKWKQRLSTAFSEPPAEGRLRIGLSWQGDPKFPADRSRSVPLKFFEPLLQVSHARYVSLQRGFGSEQLEAEPFRSRVVSFGDELDAEGGAFLDSIAVMRNLDLVITSDTAIAHLAGACGVPVWIALSRVPDWRWNRDGSHSVWYSNARLFRQTEVGNWQSVFDEMAQALL